MDLQERRKIKKILHSNAALATLAVLFAVLSVSVFKMYSRNKIASAKYNEVRRQLEDLQARKAQLESDIARFKSGEGMDEEIRKKFNVAKPGEHILVIVDKNKENDKMDNVAEGGFFSRIWGWIVK